jgi:hypothetical protein
MSKETKDRIDRILAQHDAAKEAADREHARSAIGQAQTNISGLQRFLWQFAQGLAWIWRTIGRPLASSIIAIAGWLFGWYLRLWGRLVTVTNQYGDRVFSYKRAGVMVLATAFGLYFASVLAQLTWDAGWYAYNGGWEEVYLRSPQELMGHPGEDVHAVRGCEHGPSCTELDALYYRVRFKPMPRAHLRHPQALHHAPSQLAPRPVVGEVRAIGTCTTVGSRHPSRPSIWDPEII